MKSTTSSMLQGLGMGLLLSGLVTGANAQSQNSDASRSSVVTQVKSADMSASPGNANADAAATGPANNSTITELQALIQSRTLNELRTTYNGNYGASLLFKADELVYYVAMFQQKSFWRVIKTTSEQQAEQMYKAFVDQTLQLADVDIRRIKLDAERASTEKQISANSNRLSALQNDLTVQREQEQQVAARQEQARQEAAAVASDRLVAREQLTTLQRQIRSLEEQQAKINSISPATATAATTSAKHKN